MRHEAVGVGMCARVCSFGGMLLFVGYLLLDREPPLVNVTLRWELPLEFRQRGASTGSRRHSAWQPRKVTRGYENREKPVRDAAVVTSSASASAWHQPLSSIVNGVLAHAVFFLDAQET